jgi:hypothetical protein
VTGVQKRVKVGLLAAAVAALVALAAYMSYDALSPASKEYVPPAWQNLTPQEREKRLDDEERKRRRMGRGALRPLPEDSAPRPAPLPRAP